MAFNRPTLAQLIERVRADLEFSLAGTDAHLRYTYEEVFAMVEAGLAHGLHGHLLWLSKQLIIDTSEDEYLLRWADIFGVTRSVAVAAVGFLTITGVSTTVISAGDEFQRSDGSIVTLDSDATIVAGTVDAPVTAVVAGVLANSDPGTSYTKSTPQVDVDSVATVTDVDGIGIAQGADIESIDALKVKLLSRIRTPPKGGGPGDYVNWALEVSGVTRAWELPNQYGHNTVGLTFVRDNDVSIIPDAGEVTTMQAYLDTKAPITVEVTAFAPTPIDLDVTLTTLTPNTLTIQSAIDTELEDYILRTAEPSATHYISQINEVISLAAGETDHVMTVPAANVVTAVFEILVKGTTTFPAIP